MIPRLRIDATGYPLVLIRDYCSDDADFEWGMLDFEKVWTQVGDIIGGSTSLRDSRTKIIWESDDAQG